MWEDCGETSYIGGHAWRRKVNKGDWLELRKADRSRYLENGHDVAFVLGKETGGKEERGRRECVS